MGMRSVAIFVAAILLAASAASPIQARTPETPTSKQAQSNSISTGRLTFDQDYIADDRGEDICFTQADMGLVCKPLVDWLELGINYRRIYERTDADPDKATNRPHMNVALRGQILALDVSSASWFEYRNQENQKNFWRYGNKFAVKFPFLCYGH